MTKHVIHRFVLFVIKHFLAFIYSRFLNWMSLFMTIVDQAFRYICFSTSCKNLFSRFVVFEILTEGWFVLWWNVIKTVCKCPAGRFDWNPFSAYRLPLLGKYRDKGFQKFLGIFFICQLEIFYYSILSRFSFISENFQKPTFQRIYKKSRKLYLLGCPIFTKLYPK